MSLRHPVVIVAAVVIGIALVALGIYYWVEPAGSLASFVPGHEAGSGHHHVKHGIAAFLLGVALLVFAWFQTGARARAREGAAPDS
jgi:hypothetical protein